MQPVDAILAEQRKRRAHVIVVGSRGLGIFGRFPLGSVSRRLIRAAPCAVIVTKRAPREVRRVTIAVDGSASSARAVAFVKRLNAPKRGRILLVGVVPPVPLPLMGRAPASIRSEVARHVTAKQQKREAALRRRLQNAAEALRQTGWAVTVDVRRGTPVVEILRAATSWRAEILAFGARNTRGLNRFLLGSVADGLVSRAPMSIFVAK
jgi:nucleotide-binding universal stress UspA family protein